MFFNPLPGERSNPLFNNSRVSIHPPRPWTNLQRHIGMVLPVLLINGHKMEGIFQAQHIQELEIRENRRISLKGISKKGDPKIYLKHL